MNDLPSDVLALDSTPSSTPGSTRGPNAPTSMTPAPHVASPLRLLGFFLTALLVDHATAQEAPPNDDGRLARAIADLTDQERSVQAVRTLCRNEGAAVAALMRAARDPDIRANANHLSLVVYALGKLGKAAVPATKLLLKELDSEHEPVLRNACWALGEVGPYAEAEGIAVQRALEDVAAQPGHAHQECSFARERVALGLQALGSDLIRLLASDSHAKVAAASGVLCRGSGPLSPDLTAALTAAWNRMRERWEQYGASFTRGAVEVARAVALRLPATDHAATARAGLVHHYDVEVRLWAVMEAGQHPAHARVAVPALVLALEDRCVLVRREVVTALGMLGGSAKGALACLRVLADDESEDAQVRGRAKAALRAIERAMKD